MRIVDCFVLMIDWLLGIKLMVEKLERLCEAVEGMGMGIGGMSASSSGVSGSGSGSGRLVDHLSSFEPPIEFMQFSFRWMNCFLMREFTLPQIIRLWDTYLSEYLLKKDNVVEFHIFVCLALLLHFKKDLMVCCVIYLILF